VIPRGFLRDLVERVTPSVLTGRREGLSQVDEIEAHHVRETAAQLLTRSTAVLERIPTGELAIVGLTYHLADGRVVLRNSVGDIGEYPRV